LLARCTAYEFARKFPGYTADSARSPIEPIPTDPTTLPPTIHTTPRPDISDLTDKGIHIVDARNFALIAADHPIVTALEENAAKLQTGCALAVFDATLSRPTVVTWRVLKLFLFAQGHQRVHADSNRAHRLVQTATLQRCSTTVARAQV
jgi:hypothetical protein